MISSKFYYNFLFTILRFSYSLIAHINCIYDNIHDNIYDSSKGQTSDFRFELLIIN